MDTGHAQPERSPLHCYRLTGYLVIPVLLPRDRWIDESDVWESFVKGKQLLDRDSRYFQRSTQGIVLLHKVKTRVL